MLRAYQYRLYPNSFQLPLLEGLLEAGRLLYNAALEHRLVCWRQWHHQVSYLEQAQGLKEIRQEYPDIGCLNFSACQQILRRLDKNYRALFQGIRRRPRFKAKGRFRSIEFRFGDGARLTKNRKLRLQKVGELHIHWHRSLPQGSEIKDVVITRKEGGKWYVTLRVEVPQENTPVHVGPRVGLDLGVINLVALSDGTTVEAPRYYRVCEENLTEAQSSFSKTESRRAKRKLTRLHGKVARQRMDFLHKLTRSLVRKYSFVAVENLNVLGLGRGHNSGLNKSIHDAGWGKFLTLLDYKALSAGCRVVKVDPRGTSQLCSACGEYCPKELSCRVHYCSACGLSLDRDVNAARNILLRALGWDAAFGVIL